MEGYTMTQQSINKIASCIPFKKPRNFLVFILTNFFSDELPIWATDNEKKLFEKHLKQTKNYLEFGAGDSTFFVLKNTNANIQSVESDKKFIKRMCKFNGIKKLNDKSRLVFHYIDIGRTRNFGRPKDASGYARYPNYSQAIFKILDKKHIENIDTVLIDGRFRVACLLSILLNCNKNTKVMIHDFFNRNEYHIVLDFIDVVEQVDSLGIFKIKGNIDFDRVNNLLKEYQYIFN